MTDRRELERRSSSERHHRAAGLDDLEKHERPEGVADTSAPPRGEGCDG